MKIKTIRQPKYERIIWWQQWKPRHQFGVKNNPCGNAGCWLWAGLGMLSNVWLHRTGYGTDPVPMPPCLHILTMRWASSTVTGPTSCLHPLTHCRVYFPLEPQQFDAEVCHRTNKRISVRAEVSKVPWVPLAKRWLVAESASEMLC